MYAVIFQSSQCPDASLLTVAGRALIIRQLQWLTSNGCDQIAVEITANSTGDQIADLLHHDALGTKVTQVLTPTPVGPREVAKRAGFPVGKTLAIASDILAHADLVNLFLAHSQQDTRARIDPPRMLADQVKPAEILLLGADNSSDTSSEQRTSVVHLPGWGAQVNGPATALTLGMFALSHKGAGIVIHGVEIQPGVWKSRGAVIEDNVVLRPPLLIGSQTIIRSKATVGPSVDLGDYVTIERNTTVRECIVAPHTIVGEGMDLSKFVVTAQDLTDFSGAAINLNDPLLITTNHTHHWSALIPRLIAVFATIVVLLVTLPLSIIQSMVHKRLVAIALVRKLWQIAKGQLQWVGVHYGKVTTGLISVTSVLVAKDILPTLDTYQRAHAWYNYHKSFAMDAQLLFSLMFERPIPTQTSRPTVTTQQTLALR